MKNLLIIIILALSSQVISAQINRTFWGVTLGTSTPSQVKSMLVQKGYYVEKEPDGALCVKVNNVRFGGAVWTYISFLFVNNQLSQVWFQNNEKQSPIPIENSYDLLKDNLDKKYSKYYLSLRLDEQDEKKSYYSDEKTDILLNVRKYHNIRYVSLSYEDLYLNRVKANKDKDEL